MAWRRDIIHQLHYRNETQYNVFAGVFDDYNTLLHDKKTLSAQTFQLEQDLLNVRQRSLIDPSLTSRASLLSASPSAASSAAASPASSSSAATSSSSSPSISLSTDKTKSHSDDHSSTIPSMGACPRSTARCMRLLEVYIHMHEVTICIQIRKLVKHMPAHLPACT